MATGTATTVVQKFEDHISARGGSYSQWYVGIATDPRSRLFKDHNVDENNGHWIYNTLPTSQEARAVEKYFLKLGCDGGPGGGDYHSKSVYAYRKKTGVTNP